MDAKNLDEEKSQDCKLVYLLYFLHPNFDPTLNALKPCTQTRCFLSAYPHGHNKEPFSV